MVTIQVARWTACGAAVAAIVVLGMIAVSAQQQRTRPSIAGETSPAAKDQGSYPRSPNEKGGMEETGPYEVVPDHFKPPFPPGWTWASVQGIHAESPNRVYSVLPRHHSRAGDVR